MITNMSPVTTAVDPTAKPAATIQHAAATKGKPGRKPKPRPKRELYRVKFVSFAGVLEGDVARRGMCGTMLVKTSPEGLLEVTDLAEIITRNRQGATKILKRLPRDAFDKSKFVEWNGGNYLGAKDAMEFVMSFPYKKVGSEFRRACCEVIEAYYVGSGLAEKDTEAERDAAEAERAAAEAEWEAAEAERARAERHAGEGFLIVEDSKSMPGCVKVYKQSIDRIPRVTEKPKDDSEAVAFYMWMPCEDYEAELRGVMEMLRGKRATHKKGKGVYYRLESDDDRLDLISYMNVRMHQYGKGGADTFYK